MLSELKGVAGVEKGLGLSPMMDYGSELGLAKWASIILRSSIHEAE